MKIYCITHKPLNIIEKLGLIPAGVGETKFPSNYIIENSANNIASKNKHYSETSFHYWIWKNILPQKKDNDWFGTCQYRRYFVKEEFEHKIDNSEGRQGFLDLKNDFANLNNILQKKPSEEWNGFDVILCKPWSVSGAKKMKILKRGIRSLLKDPRILFDKEKQTIKLHFDMFHGYGNLDKAIELLPDKDKLDFINYVSSNTLLSGHCIFFSNNPQIVEKFYQDLFGWLFKCEKVFGFKNLIGYDTQRIYSFLTERYMPFWFEKYSKVKFWPWVYCDITKIKS